MNYGKFIADFETEKIDPKFSKLYDFACLKVARHSLSNSLNRNNFDDKTEKK